MNVETLLVSTWPQNPIVWPATKECKAFIAKCEQQDEVSLADLIDFADRDDTPSVSLTRSALSMVIMIVFERCRSETKMRAEQALQRPLTLIPRYTWAERLKFHDGGFSFTAGQDYDAEIKRIRKQILES